MKPKLATIKASPPASSKVRSKGLLAEVRELILEARQTVARGVNAALVLLYWNVGQRIRKEILREKRAQYGQMIFSTLSRKLMAEFGRGFSQQNLFKWMFTRIIQYREIVL
jgi:hypothetical protein